MTKELEGLAAMKEKEIKSVLNGTSYAVFSAKGDLKKYKKYISGKGRFSEYELKEMEIISILERLGYSLDELGTYLYKEVIMYAHEEINSFDRRDVSKAENLLESMNDAFSSFYHIIAREDLELGIKSFHKFIGLAIDKIDNEKIDGKLAEKIFGKNPVESNYGVQAFKIASYMSSKYMIKYSNQKVKKLPNMPE